MVAHHFLDLATVIIHVKRGREGCASAGVGEEKVNRGEGYVHRSMSGGMDQGEGGMLGCVKNPADT